MFQTSGLHKYTKEVTLISRRIRIFYLHEEPWQEFPSWSWLGVCVWYATSVRSWHFQIDRSDGHKFPVRRHFSSHSDYLFTGRRAYDGNVCVRPYSSHLVTVIDNNASLTSTRALILLKHNLRGWNKIQHLARPSVERTQTKTAKYFVGPRKLRITIHMFSYIFHCVFKNHF